MAYLHLFQAQSACTKERSENYNEPWVSYTKETQEVLFNKTEYEKLLETPLTFEFISGGTFRWANVFYGEQEETPNVATIEYKLNDGEWTEITSSDYYVDYGALIANVSAGDIVQVRGDNPAYSEEVNYSHNAFYTNEECKYNVKGNIMSLINSTDYANTLDLQSGYTFVVLFAPDWESNYSLIDASELVLPATGLTEHCYEEMFEECVVLNKAPKILPSTTLAPYCYAQMFVNCTGLTTAPSLPATTLANSCYYNMFSYCYSLTSTPVLPATTLAEYCYQGMFAGCTSLTTLPTDMLPATTLAPYCYEYMFEGCTSLTTAPALPATTLALYCYLNMFAGCTSLTTAPELSETTLARGCYLGMFAGCTGLTSAPSLPATTLEQVCYSQMFSGCTNLNYIKCLATNISATDCTKNWVNGVQTVSGTFVRPSGVSWTSGVNGVPNNWTIQDA